MSEESSDDENFDPELLIRDFESEAQLVMNNLLPPKSKNMYLKAYNDFMEWKNENSASFDESVFLVYFEELSKTFKPPTLWSIWSKLKATLNIKEKIDLDKYHMLKTSLKNKCKGYKPKKSKILTLSQIKQFLELADDDIYLAMKVALIFGFFGALRSQEITNLKTTDIEDTNNQFIITINETKTYVSRNFIISKEYYNVIKKYVLLRPDGMDSHRFFVSYHKGKCTRQYIGKNKISEIPSIVATFLQLEEPEKYTGHCYRRSSATALSNAGADLIKVKNHGGWKSDNVAQGYVDFSTANRRQIFDMIANSDNLPQNHFLQHPPVITISNQRTAPSHVPSTSTSSLSVPSTSSNTKIDNEFVHVQTDKVLNEPPLKKTKSSSNTESSKQDLHNLSSGIFQNCEIHINTFNVNNYYYSCNHK